MSVFLCDSRVEYRTRKVPLLHVHARDVLMNSLEIRGVDSDMNNVMMVRFTHKTPLVVLVAE